MVSLRCPKIIIILIKEFVATIHYYISIILNLDYYIHQSAKTVRLWPTLQVSTIETVNLTLVPYFYSKFCRIFSTIFEECESGAAAL